jgi:hypothetical protein
LARRAFIAAEYYKANADDLRAKSRTWAGTIATDSERGLVSGN